MKNPLKKMTGSELISEVFNGFGTQIQKLSEGIALLQIELEENNAIIEDCERTIDLISEENDDIEIQQSEAERLIDKLNAFIMV